LICESYTQDLLLDFSYATVHNDNILQIRSISWQNLCNISKHQFCGRYLS